MTYQSQSPSSGALIRTDRASRCWPSARCRNPIRAAQSFRLTADRVGETCTASLRSRLRAAHTFGPESPDLLGRHQLEVSIAFERRANSDGQPGIDRTASPFFGQSQSPSSGAPSVHIYKALSAIPGVVVKSQSPSSGALIRTVASSVSTRPASASCRNRLRAAHSFGLCLHERPEGVPACRSRLRAAHSFGPYTQTLTLTPPISRNRLRAAYSFGHALRRKDDRGPGSCVAIAFERRTYSDAGQTCTSVPSIRQSRNRLRAAHSFGPLPILTQ